MLSFSHQISHGVKPRSLHTSQEASCPNGAGGKDLPAHSGVAQLNDLILTGEDHFMVSHNVAAPDSGDADLSLFPGFADAVAVIDILRLIGEGLGRRIGDHGLFFCTICLLGNLAFLTLWEANARYPFCYSCCLLLFGAALLAAPRSEEQGTS